MDILHKRLRDPGTFEFQQIGFSAEGPRYIDLSRAPLDIALHGVTGVFSIGVRAMAGEHHDPCLDSPSCTVQISRIGPNIFASPIDQTRRSMSYSQKLCATQRLATIAGITLYQEDPRGQTSSEQETPVAINCK